MDLLLKQVVFFRGRYTACSYSRRGVKHLRKVTKWGERGATSVTTEPVC